MATTVGTPVSVSNFGASKTAATTSATKTTGSNSLTKDDFLKILMTQLKYQDPMSPADPSQFLAQLSQLTQVEQMTNMAKSLEDMKTITEKGSVTQWVSSIGKKMNVDDNVLSQGDQVYLTPSGDYDRVVLAVKNRTTGEVSQVTINKGEPLVYKNEGTDVVEVAAVAVKNNAPTTCGMSLFRIVKGVEFGESGATLVASDGTAYLASSVKQIKE